MRSLMCLLFAGSICSAAEPANKPYASEEGKFSALFPGKPTRTAAKETKNEKPVPVVTLSFVADDVTYRVAFRDYPAGALDEKPAVALLALQKEMIGTGSVDEAKAGMFGTGKLPMRQFSYSQGKLFVRTQLVMQKSRVFEITVAAPSEKVLAAPATTAFIDSFKFTGGAAIEFVSKDGLFTVTLPGQPKRESSKVAVGDEFIQVKRETQEIDGVAYVLAFNDYPAGTLDPDPKKVLVGVRDGNIGEGTIDEDKTGTFGKEKYPMREFTFTKDKLFFRNRIILVGDRLYQVMAVAEKEEYLKRPAVIKMYDTFKITKMED